MPKTREQIKHDPVSAEVWRDNRTQAGGLWFDPRQIRPLSDHILVELEEATDPTTLVVPDVARNRDIGTRRGVVLEVGPGKWTEDRSGWPEPIPSHVLLPLRFKPTTLKPGDQVLIGHYSDWESWGSDFEGRAKNIVLCQEADVRLAEPHDCLVFAGDDCIECGRKFDCA